MDQETIVELPNKELFNQLCKGSEVEVLYGKQWYLSKVLKVVDANCQIFIHYKGWNSRHDHWVLVGDGVRLPGTDASMWGSPTKTSSNNTHSSVADAPKSPHESAKDYKPGTMLLGEWKDGYKYVCFVQSTNANGFVNVKFYDGSRGSLIRAKLSPVTDIAIKEYEQWKYEESQIKEYEKRTGKRVKSFEQLVKILAVNSSTPTKNPSSALTNLESKDEFIVDIRKESTTPPDSLDTINSSCPETGKFQCEQLNCGKSFRKLTLLLHHTKHYHKNSNLVHEQVSKSCSADVLATQLKERRFLGTSTVACKRKFPVQEILSSPADVQSPITDEQIFASDVSNCDIENEKISEPSSSNADHETLRFASKQKNRKNKPKLKLTGGSKYYCKLCGGSFTSGKSYQKHMTIHGRPSIETETDNEISKKGDIEIVATGPQKLKQPKVTGSASKAESHHGKDFTCPVCSQKFLTEESLGVHQKVRLHFAKREGSQGEGQELKLSSTEKPREPKPTISTHGTDQNEKSSALVLEDLKFKSPLKTHSTKKNSRRIQLLNSLKKPKLPKFSGESPKIKIQCNFESTYEEKNGSDIPNITTANSETEPAFVPVFLDPPSADESNEVQTPNLSMTIDQSESQNIPILSGNEQKRYTGKMYEKAHPLVCTFPDCDKSFRKQSFLDLHVKHYHSAKTGFMKESVNQSNSKLNRASVTKPVAKKTSAPMCSKNKSGTSMAKKFLKEPKHVISKLSSPSVSDNVKPAASTQNNEESSTIKTPIKESYNDILNDSLTAKAETSPLSSDVEENFAEKLTVKSVHDSPNQQGLKKVFKLNFMPFSSETHNQSVESQKSEISRKSNKFKRAIIDDSECESVASVDSEGWSGETIKCVCNYVEVFGTMVQCSYCNVWLHAECLDVNENSLPEEYECPYCEVKRRIRKSEEQSCWYSHSSPEDPLGSGCPTEPIVQQTAPWVVATDQLSEDLHQLQSMIETFEELYEVMRNPGHVYYPQLVLRFQNDLQTFDSQSSKLEYSDLDPNVVKLIMELEESSNRLIQPEELSPVGTSCRNETSDPIDDPNNLDSSLEIDESRDSSEGTEKSDQPIITWLSPEKMDLDSLDNTSSGNMDNHSFSKLGENTDLNEEKTKSDVSSEPEKNVVNSFEEKKSGSMENESTNRDNEAPVRKKAARNHLMDFDPSVPPKNILEMMNRLLFQLETRMDHLENLFEKLESGYDTCVEGFPTQKCHYKFSDESEDSFRNEMRILSNDLFLITQLSKIAP